MLLIYLGQASQGGVYLGIVLVKVGAQHLVRCLPLAELIIGCVILCHVHCLQSGLNSVFGPL